MGFGRIEAHARLAQDMFTALEGRQGNRTVQVGPGAHDHGVDIGIGHQVLPAFKSLGDAKFTGGGGRRGRASIANCHNFHLVDATEPRDMPGPHVVAGADQADAEAFGFHGQISVAVPEA